MIIIILYIFLFFLFFLVGILIFFFLSSIFTFLKNRKIPYVPSSKKTIKKIKKYILENFQDKEKIKIVDLGSGDGIIVFELAKAGYFVDGYELDFFLIMFSNFFKKILRLKNKVNFYREDFLKVDFKKYDIFIAYLLPEIMDILEKKLEKEAKRGAIFISNSFSFKNRKPLEIIDEVYIYQF